ncbi:dUTPase-like protein [Laetiporus sulphureus 93-53]|uniref:Deoxyuridine 5'-triphosphate nucleotidohydrolase n=1 Tax=Laetiporus sulphureus 93-53 TaxID=1314785 RepID=A0A165B9P2_9APHY|nr:dUTPase-like protein [Laetiporus sulphureus 93-53]KZT00566.1 dUTPase-like protein [Laetiporus sulphureus 93-53]
MSDHPDEFFLYYKMTDLAKSSKKSSNEAAGWDIYAAEMHEIPLHSRAVVGTGVVIDPPKHTYTRIAPCSRLAARGIDVGAGVVDPNYTGELKVVLINTTDFIFSVKPGDRIAQIIFEYYAEGLPSQSYQPL